MFATERLLRILRYGAIQLFDLIEAVAGRAAANPHPPVRNLFAGAELAVLELVDQPLAVFADRIEHLADFEIAIAEGDVFNVVADELIEGTHVLEHLGDCQHLRFIEMLDVFEQIDQFVLRVGLAAEPKPFERRKGSVEVLPHGSLVSRSGGRRGTLGLRLGLSRLGLLVHRDGGRG